MIEHAHEGAPSDVRKPDDAPFVVGLGASAGGIKALREFFSHVRPDTGAVYVVILHLSPDHDSKLAEVLQRVSPLPVTQVTGATRIEPDHVYVVPPNKSLELRDTVLVLADVTRVEQRRAPIDVFFRTLAEVHGSRAVCVVLSGTGPDGSDGLKRVKEFGGLAIAQDPVEADYNDMPRNSIATGLVDFVLRTAEMPDRIQAYREQLQFEDPPLPAAEVLAVPDPLRDVVGMMRVRTGHDFSNYKIGTLRRRINRRMHLCGASSLEAYADLVRENPDEAVALMKDLLISVTNFFRDPGAFETLAAVIIPQIFQGKTPHYQVRTWVAGCATGEEAYSIAMLLCEHAQMLPEAATMMVFATDLDDHAIARARVGIYSGSDIADVSEERLARFFHREGAGYRVRRELREMVLFASHNVIKDPPFSHVDLIACRNLLIYLNRPIQEKVIETFHYALRPGGYLFLGGAEAPGGLEQLFVTADRAAHIHQSRPVISRIALRPAEPLTNVRPHAAEPVAGRLERVAPLELHQQLLEQYGPPSVVVNGAYLVVHMSERAGRYFQLTGGEVSNDLFKLARHELRTPLRAALHQAERERAAVAVQKVKVDLGEGNVRELDLSVKPALGDGPGRGCFLITFDDTGAGRPDAPRPLSGTAPMTAQFEEELIRMRQQLLGTIREYETQVEEAKAVAEELQAMNEELRSSAEELETGKEELESVNEELTTVNEELKLKIEELAETNNNYQNLINSTDIGTIFLDRDLRVKMSTPSAREIFNLLSSDIGRPLSDITSHLRYDGLHDDVGLVLGKLQTIDRELETHNGRWHLTRLRPYRTLDDRIDGVVITFQDITDRRRAESMVRESEERLRLLIDSVVDYAIFTMSIDGRIDSWNPGAQRLFGFTAEEIIGRHVEELFTAEDRLAGQPAVELQRAQLYGRAVHERALARKDGSILHCSGVTTRLGGAGLGFAMVARDLSAPRHAADAVRAARAQADALVRERTGQLQAEVFEYATAQTQIRSLLRKIVTAQEDERSRIARDLHDQLGQQLTALRLTLEQHRDKLTEGTAAADDIILALGLAHAIDRDVDFLAWELRPSVLDDLGLSAALPRFIRDWSAHCGIAAEYRADGFAAGQLTPEAEVVFYRVAQEALNNVAKHAHASRVDVMLGARAGSVVLLVEDDGVGFDPQDREVRERGIGLMGMQERAGLVGAALDVESVPGEGASVFLRCQVCDKTFGGT